MSFSINDNMLNTISSLVSPTVRTPFRPKSSRLDNRRRQVPASVYRLIYYAFTCLFRIASCCPPVIALTYLTSTIQLLTRSWRTC